MPDCICIGFIKKRKGERQLRKKWLFLLLNIFFCMLLCGCGDTTAKVTILTEADNEVVSIPVLLRIDPETGKSEYVDLIKGFNEEYEGQYRVEVQWVTETEQGYRERLKLLNALDQLPVIITDAAFSSEFYDLMIENKRFVNLYPYLKDKEEWQDLFAYSSAEEEVFFVPLNKGIFSSAGLFYNKSMFSEAEIEEMPSTWEEFYECLEQLESKGITPLALHGSGEYWSPMLISTAYMCSEESGKAFLNERFPKSYDNDSMRRLLTCMYSLYEYSFSDAVDIDFNQAKERFLKKEAAMIANGFWMIYEIDEEAQEDIGFIPFPENMMMVDEQMSSWAVVSGYDEEVIRGAVEFLAYREKNSEIAQESLTDLGREYMDAFAEIGDTYPNYQFYWREEILNDFFNKAFPEFLDGTGDMDAFILQMDRQVENIK